MGVMKWIGAGLAIGIVGAAVGSAVWLWSPETEQSTVAVQAARDVAAGYDARVIRDRFGVPHVYGHRNADVAFGIAYAHAEDDWRTIEEVIRQNRGTLAALNGKDAAASDYLMLALGNIEAVDRDYDTQVSAAGKAVAEGYAAGLNLWCADHPETGCWRTLPASGKDVIKGYANRPPFFYGLDGELAGVLQGSGPVDLSVKSARAAYLKTSADIELGSNAIAVSPLRSSDGHTRLAVNSHQPYTGTVAWYEARLKSDEGIDMIGGLFPGSPLILHGAGPDLGWAATVNKPDVSDVFLLTVDNPKKPRKYMMDGAWKDLEVFPIKFRVHLWGPFALPVTQQGYRSEHGPVFVTDRGVFAVSYAGDQEIRYVDQYLAMNTAKTVAEWRAGQERINAIPSINYVVADSKGDIAYFWNARMPKREPGWDRSKVLPGDTSDTLWKGWEPVSSLPAVINPPSGWVENSNNSPLHSTSLEDAPKAEDYPKDYGLDTLVTNRGLRAQVLFGGDPDITREDFLTYKMDHQYDERSNVMKLVRDVAALGADGDPQLQEAIDLMTSWNGSADRHNRAAALPILAGQVARGGQIHDDATPEKEREAVKSVAERLRNVYDRIDPEWGEVSMLQRGDKTWPLDGGPDTLRAVYANGDLEVDGHLHGVAGDTYILIADWAPDGAYRLDTIHQFGSATLDATSPHYGDQAPLFAEEQFRQPPMTLEGVLAEAERDYRPGK
ncbi:MAG: penicillin acylase family protein [Hyphomonadaceae bacterium]